MKKAISKTITEAIGALLIPAGLLMASCAAEPDDSNLYVFNGETIEDFIQNNDSSFSSFNYMLKKIGYDRILSSYGTYTCFVPTNAAVKVYLDSLYNDQEAMIPHNGMSSNSLEGMTDSLCRDIVLFHLTREMKKTTDMSAADGYLTTLLGRQITTSVVNGMNVLNDRAAITMSDYEVVNGVVHVINNVIPRSNRLVGNELDKIEGYEIFSRALKLTGIADSLLATEKDQVFSELPTIVSGEDGETSYWITKTPSKIKFTIFAESDEVFRAHGINDLEVLIDSCKKWYAYAAESPKNVSASAGRLQGWYDWYRNGGVTVSTGTDYESQYNVLNMFVRYHILKYGVAKNCLTIDQNVYDKDGWNGDTFDYYETMLPKTLMKVWKVKSFNGMAIDKTYVNRYVTNNTLTDGVETVGSCGPGGMHQVVYEGNEIDLSGMTESLNGYIYPLKDILLYNAQVPSGVLNERMRFDVLALLPEVMSSGFRGIYQSDFASITNESGRSRVRFPVDYFDNVRVYNGNKTRIDMNIIANPNTNAFLLYKGDSFQGKGVYDLAIKLPPVPDGLYELRVAATNFGTARGSMMQFYLGTSSELTSMEAIDIPIDLRMNTYNDDDNRLGSIGYIGINDDPESDAYADRGVESDKVMRAHNYMRDGLSIVKESDGSVAKGRNWNARYLAYQFRRILTKRDFRQRDYWLRMKTVLPKYDDRKYQLDYIELVPVNVYENGRYMEDMY